MRTHGLKSVKYKGYALTKELYNNVAAAAGGKLRFAFLVCVSCCLAVGGSIDGETEEESKGGRR